MIDEREQDAVRDAAPGTATDEGFLLRWSRRKRDAHEAEERTEQPPAPKGAAQVAPDTAESEPLELTDADMPPVESLDEHSDYRGFLSPKVSEGLRRAALRKLFGLSRFNVCDGLDDYAQDFTSFEPLGDLVTHDMCRLLLRERERLAEALEPGEELEQVPRLAASGERSREPEPNPPSEKADGDAEGRTAVAPPEDSEH